MDQNFLGQQFLLSIRHEKSTLEPFGGMPLTLASNIILASDHEKSQLKPCWVMMQSLVQQLDNGNEKNCTRQFGIAVQSLP